MLDDTDPRVASARRDTQAQGLAAAAGGGPLPEPFVPPADCPSGWRVQLVGCGCCKRGTKVMVYGALACIMQRAKKLHHVHVGRPTAPCYKCVHGCGCMLMWVGVASGTLHPLRLSSSSHGHSRLGTWRPAAPPPHLAAPHRIQPSFKLATHTSHSISHWALPFSFIAPAPCAFPTGA